MEDGRADHGAARRRLEAHCRLAGGDDDAGIRRLDRRQPHHQADRDHRRQQSGGGGEAAQRQAIAAETLDHGRQLATLTGEFPRTGAGNLADADRATAALALLKNEAARADEASAVASARLAQQLSSDPSLLIVPQEDTIVPIDLVPLDSVAVNDLIATGLTNRPELAASRALVCEAVAPGVGVDPTLCGELDAADCDCSALLPSCPNPPDVSGEFYNVLWVMGDDHSNCMYRFMRQAGPSDAHGALRVDDLGCRYRNSTGTSDNSFVFGLDRADAPRDAWTEFARLPLNRTELRVVANNLAPYLRK